MTQKKAAWAQGHRSMVLPHMEVPSELMGRVCIKESAGKFQTEALRSSVTRQKEAGTTVEGERRSQKEARMTQVILRLLRF